MLNHKHFLKVSILSAISLCLVACNGFFDKDNTPAPAALVYFTPEVTPKNIWSTRATSGVNDDDIKMGFTVTKEAVFAAGSNGTVTALDKTTGERKWQVKTGLPITTAPGVGNQLVVIANRRGIVSALDEETGAIRWQKTIPGQIFATPAIKQYKVIIKTIDGHVRALAANDGHEIWTYQQTEPSLILHSGSTPLIQDNAMLVGFANGNLAKLNLNDGQPQWSTPLAIPQGGFAIQRMIDVDADPILFDHRIFGATYQGKIASLNWSSGQTLWSHDISSYTGMIADHNAIYITDAEGHVWAFNTDSGLVSWRQDKLAARILTGPAIMDQYVVVGDQQGYMHWLSKQDGHIAARVYMGVMNAAPIVEDNVLYAVNTKGDVAAYKLS